MTHLNLHTYYTIHCYFYFEVQDIEDGQQLEVDGNLFKNGFDLTFYFIKAPSLEISVNILSVLLLLKNS